MQSSRLYTALIGVGALCALLLSCGQEPQQPPPSQPIVIKKIPKQMDEQTALQQPKPAPSTTQTARDESGQRTRDMRAEKESNATNAVQAKGTERPGAVKEDKSQTVETRVPETVQKIPPMKAPVETAEKTPGGGKREEKVSGGDQSQETVKEEQQVAKAPEETVKPSASDTGKIGAKPKLDKKADSVTKEETPAVKQVAYHYSSGGRPDPFLPFTIVEQAEATLKECEGIPPGPLTEQDANQFHLVAIIKKGSENMAMVQDPEGKGYLLREGTYIGKKCGKVTAIQYDSLQIKEPYLDVLGRRKIKEITFKLEKKEG